MTSFRRHLTYANVMATLAVVIAVAGIPSAVAITANKVKKNAVGTKQLKNGSVTAAKLADGNVTAAKLAGVRVVSATASTPSPSGTDAACDAGEKLLGGGAITQGGALIASSPVTQLSPPRWNSNSSGGPTTAAFALCLRTTPGG
jgi:hypothetical protein